MTILDADSILIDKRQNATNVSYNTFNHVDSFVARGYPKNALREIEK